VESLIASFDCYHIFHTLFRQPCGTLSLDSEVVRALEEAADTSTNAKRKAVTMQVIITLFTLHIPLAKEATKESTARFLSM